MYRSVVLLSPMCLKSAFLRLNKRKDILDVYANGARLLGRSFDLIVLRRGGGALRVAVIVPLLGMGAVKRNRLKRRTNEALRRGGFLTNGKGDVIVRAKKAAYDLSYSEILLELRDAFASMVEGQ